MDIKNQHPDDLRAKKFTDLVMKEGMAPSKAAKIVDVSMSDLRTQPGVWSEVRSLLERTQGLLDPEIRKKLAKAKLIELALQEEDLKVSLGATKTLHEELGLIQKQTVQLGVQVNVLKDDPQVKSAMDTIEIAGEVAYDEEKKSFSLVTPRVADGTGEGPVSERRLLTEGDSVGQGMDGVPGGASGV